MSYRKIDTRIWNDAKFMSLSDDAKLLFFFCLTHPNLTMVGAMRATRAGIAEELGWLDEGLDEGLPKRFTKPFSELLDCGLVRYEKCGLLWLPNFLKYNPLENQNQCKGAAKALDLLPECELKIALISHIKTIIETLSEGFGKGLPEGFVEGFGKPETGTETGKEKSLAKKNKVRVPKTDHSFFTSWWCYSFECVNGFKYAYNSKEAGHVKNILSNLGGDVRQAVARAARLLISEDEFYKGKKTLAMLMGCINQLNPIENGDLSVCRSYGILPPDGVKLSDWKFWEENHGD